MRNESNSSKRKPVNLITHNENVQKMIDRIDRVVSSNSSILLVGETGVGKEIFAEYVHYNSLRYDKPFVKVSLSALSSDLLESELFGHEKGSFTSAHTEKKGLFEIADTGSIFLDDIDDVPLEIQTKLLRVLESHELMRIGGTKPIPIDVRVITASKVDLKLLIEKGRFRSDLFYRINVVPVQIPPLRERREDIRPLVNYFFGYYAPEEEFELSDDALRAIESYSWPGNVRELRNVIQRLTLLTEGSIDTHDLPIEIKNEDPQEIILKACDRCFVDNKMSFESVVNCLEVNLLRQALSRAECNQTQAAKMLNMSLSTFRDKIKKYNVDCSTNH